MKLAQRTLVDLGFPEIARTLSSRCKTELGRERAQAIGFFDTAGEVREQLSRTDEARQLEREDGPLPIGGIADIRPALYRASKGAVLEPKELIQVGHVLSSFAWVRDFLQARQQTCPLLSTISQRLPSLVSMANRIQRSFEPSGEISDYASPELREARERCRGLHRALESRIDKMLHDEKFLELLREPYFTIRNSRYVFPVLAQRRAEVPGIVHNASQSGQTLFIEPETLIAQGNDLAIAESLQLEEERRILQTLSGEVGRVATELSQGIEAAAELDIAQAAASLAAEIDANIPVIEEEAGPLDLVQFRHPLLLLRGKEVVANDVTLSDQVKGLVISGPNAGGKTATLTAVGLCSLMLRAGLPIPARPNSRLPLYRSIHSIVGDAQDLSHDLSTFSGHVEQLRQIGEAAGFGSLVLIDEIAADTNPREGAALAIAVLENLIERGATVLVTTHLEELKALQHVDARFRNASVGFDPKRLAPTYRLQLGLAGTSSAIDIAARVGLPRAICDRARELALGAAGPFSKALAALEEERGRLSEETEKAKQTTAAAELLRKQLEEEKLAHQQRQVAEELAQREQLRKELAGAGKEIRDLLSKLRAEATLKETEEAQRRVEERLTEESRRIGEIQNAAAKPSAPRGPPQLRVGGWVHHQGMEADVEILDLTGDTALVAAGPLKRRVPISELTASRGSRPKAQFSTGARSERAFRKAEQVAPAATSASAPRCDLRGMRLDDALREVMQFLDRSFRSGEGEALIIHGHGTGALKRAVRELLAGSPYIRLYRPGDSHEGGDGVTVVAFKD